MPNLSDPDRLLSIANYLYIGNGALTLTLTLAIVFLGNAVARRKQAEIRAYQADADVRIAESNARAAEAFLAAGRANELAQQAALDKAKIEKDNLVLQEQIENEQKARLVIERKIAPRFMNVTQMGEVWGIEQTLGVEPVDIIFYADDPEVRFLAGNLSVALQKWSPSLFEVPGGLSHDVGIYFDMNRPTSKARAELITAALRRASPMTLKGPFAASHQFSENIAPEISNPSPRADIRIVVGYR